MKKQRINNNQISKLLKIRKYFWSHKQWVLLFAIFALELFFRFYQIEERNPFGWDQVDNAWAAKNLIVNHHYTLVGMVAKGNSGFYIGPAYYYLISIVYWITNLDPIASGIFAGITSIFTFWVLFFVTRKLFSFSTAVIAVFINTVTFNAIIFDRVQWPVNFIPAISLLIFYFLYKIITGHPRYLLFLSIALGFAFQIHFTAIFFPILIFLALPFFARNKKTILYFLISIPLFLVWLMPNILYELQSKSSQSSHLTKYLGTNYHGFHLKRVMQIIGDGLIQFEPYLYFPFLKFLKYMLLPIFLVVYMWRDMRNQYVSLKKKNDKGVWYFSILHFARDNKNKLLLCYLVVLWFIVPWFAFSTYSGEISDYYFSINRFIALLVLAYLLAKTFAMRNIFLTVIVSIALLYYGYVNTSDFLAHKDTGLMMRRAEVLQKINAGQKIQYVEGVPESYLYYYYMRQKGKTVYER